MSTDIETSDGGDPAGAIVAGLEGQEKELTKEYAQLWHQESTDWLTEAAENRAELGRAHGREGREMTGLFALAKSAMHPEWEDGEWVWAIPHRGAVFQEFGAMPHEIRAKKAEVLAFEWPDAPQEVQEQFSHTEGDLVFFESINHPGIPAIGFMRYGRDQAKKFLEQNGHEAEVF